MKVSEIKHNHSLTDLLKIVIFSILMLLPFLSIGTRCLYVICNKNAYQSYSDKQMIQELTNVTNSNQLLENDIVECKYSNEQGTTSFSFKMGFSQLSFNPTDYGFSNLEYNYIQTYGQRIYLYVDSTYYSQDIWGTSLTEFTIVYNGLHGSTSEQLNTVNVKTFKLSYYPSKLDNVFEYSINQMTNSPTFNWTQNTALYTGVKGMTDNLQVQTNLIAVLIVYWTILTIIYIILDIVLKCFEWLTHGLIKKS